MAQRAVTQVERKDTDIDVKALEEHCLVRIEALTKARSLVDSLPSIALARKRIKNVEQDAANILLLAKENAFFGEKHPMHISLMAEYSKAARIVQKNWAFYRSTCETEERKFDEEIVRYQSKLAAIRSIRR